MGAPRYTDEQFIAAWRENGASPTVIARALGMSQEGLYARRARMAKRGIILPTASRPRRGGFNGREDSSNWQIAEPKWPKRREIECKGRSILVGSDAHFWPGIRTCAFQALLKVARSVEPEYLILNGDTLDGARISRHDPIAWEVRPTLQQEIECVEDRIHEIRKAAPNAKTLWTCGNHDTRFERYLAKNAPEFRDVKGSCLQDLLQGWPMSWSIMVNAEHRSPVMIKHAFRGGAHAVYNNTLHAGISIVTGHLHAQLVRPFTDYNGTRYGVDAGTLADIDGDQFTYTMDGPVNWRSGFALLSFDPEGRLLPPETCEVQTFGKHQRAIFRGKTVLELTRE